MRTKGKTGLDPLQKADLPTAVYPGGFRRVKGNSRKRILGSGQDSNSYHVMSRTAGGEMLFGDVEKEAFVRVMRRMERFSGVEVMTYAVMGNHFHLLVRVPNREQFVARFEGKAGEKRLMGHLGLLYSKGFVNALRGELADLRKRGMNEEAERLLEKFKGRFCELKTFVKELKERFSRWYNKHHGRKGTLWMDRYKSVLVEDGEALRTMACYIDLNPLRAGLCEDPKDYRWCGYAEAVAGSKRARRGLCRVMERALDSWNEKPVKKSKGSLTAAQWYRCWLFGDGIEVVAPGSGAGAAKLGKRSSVRSRKGISARRVREVKAKGGVLSRAELLRCRVRYFSDGVVIGSRSFVEGVFEEHRGKFGAKRKSGARVIREAPEAGLFSLRDLRVQAVE